MIDYCAANINSGQNLKSLSVDIINSSIIQGLNLEKDFNKNHFLCTFWLLSRKKYDIRQ